MTTLPVTQLNTTRGVIPPRAPAHHTDTNNPAGAFAPHLADGVDVHVIPTVHGPRVSVGVRNIAIHLTRPEVIDLVNRLMQAEHEAGQ
jgi:hypothetical protein